MYRCSGIHRGMGTHISRVKSVDLDTWTDEQLQSMIKWGNARANKWVSCGYGENDVANNVKILGSKTCARSCTGRSKDRELHTDEVRIEEMVDGRTRTRPIYIGRRGRRRFSESAGIFFAESLLIVIATERSPGQSKD